MTNPTCSGAESLAVMQSKHFNSRQLQLENAKVLTSSAVEFTLAIRTRKDWQSTGPRIPHRLK